MEKYIFNTYSDFFLNDILELFYFNNKKWETSLVSGFNIKISFYQKHSYKFQMIILVTNISPK